MKKLFLIFAIILSAGNALARPVVYNTQRNIYHYPDCKYAKLCTKNCITIDESQAKAKGARLCNWEH